LYKQEKYEKKLQACRLTALCNK